MRRRFWVIGFVAIVLAATPVAALAAWSRLGSPNPIPTARTHFTEQSARYVATVGSGPSIQCGSDFCSIGLMKRVRFNFNANRDSYKALLTVSMDYRASAGDKFTIKPRLDERRQGDAPTSNRPGSSLKVFPSERRLPMARSGSSTFQWMIRGLKPSTYYDLTLEFDPALLGTNGYHVSSRHLVITVERL